MTSFLWDLVALNGILILLFLVFKLVQRQLTFGQQRWSILTLPFLAIGVLLAKYLLILPTWSYTIPVIELRSIEIATTTSLHSSEFSWLSLQNVYLLGMVLFLGWLIVRLTRIFRLFQQTTNQTEDGFRVVELPNRDSFSFFRWIQLRQGLEEQDRSIVLQHEKIHAQKGHSVDQIYLEVIQCVAWFNPIIPLIKKELTQVHEFEVDQIMYNKYQVSYMEFLLSYSLGTSSSSYLLTNQLMGHPTLIKRIKIMKNNTKKRGAFALVLPLLAGSLSLVSWTYEKSSTPVPVEKVAGDPVTEVDKMPEFKGGMDAMIKYLSTNIKYPESAKNNKITGKVITSFMVTETGKVTAVSIKRGVNAEIDAEAKRVVESMPDWIPAEKDGKKVSAEMILPIAFQL